MRPGRATLLVCAASVGALACDGSPIVGIDASNDGGAPRDAGADGRVRGARDAAEAAARADAGFPVLTALDVTSAPGLDATAAASLTPPFASGVHDYYVRCLAGPNALTVSMTASPGATSALMQPTVTAELPAQTVSLSVLENEAIVAVAADGPRRTEYWVRCLPHDVAPMTWTALPDASAPPPGYYLLGNFFSAPGESGYAMVLDRNGVPVWYARSPDGGAADDVDSLEPGTVSFDPFAGPKVGASFVIRTLAPPSTSLAGPAGFAPTLHELQLLPGGDYLVIASPPKVADFTGRTLPLPDGGALPLGAEEMLDCVVVEFTKTGSVVWTWAASDHFGTDALTLIQPAFAKGSGADGGVLLDGFHCNSIDVDPSTGDLLVSARDMDSIFYVERATGKVRWKMGGAPSSVDGATYVSVPDPFFRQHDARLLPGWAPGCRGGSGQISLFDDESYVPGAVARGVVYDVVVGGPDGGALGDAGCGGGSAAEAGAPGTAARTWQYRGAAASGLTGSFRVSPDGSRVIDWGFGGTPRLVFTEVDVAGNDLLELRFAHSEASYRTIKLPTTAFDLRVLRQTAGSP